jgi:hypothetical protein
VRGSGYEELASVGSIAERVGAERTVQATSFPEDANVSVIPAGVVMGTKRDPIQSVAATPRNGTSERRSVCRYSVVQHTAWLGWWVGQEFTSTPAQVVDISLRGALLTVDALPPNEPVLWLSAPGAPADDEWLEAKQVAATKRFFGPRQVRISFSKVFPYDVFKALVYGPDKSQANWLTPEEIEADRW